MADTDASPKKRKNPKEYFRSLGKHYPRLLRMARTEWPALSLGTVFLVIGTAMGLWYPKLIGDIIDSALTVLENTGATGDHTQLNNTVKLMLLIFLVQGVAVGIRFYLFTMAGYRIVTRLRSETFGHIIRQEFGFFDQRKTGELLSRLTSDTTVLQNTVSVNVSETLRHSAAVVGGIILLFVASAQLTLIMLVVVPPVVISSLYFGRVIQRLSKKMQDALARANEVAEESIAGVRTVHAFTNEPLESGRYDKEVNHALGITRKRVISIGWFVALITFTGYGAVALVFWFGGRMVADGSMTAGELTSFIIWTLTVAFSLGGLGNLFADLMRAIGSAERVFEILDRQPDAHTVDGKTLDQVQGAVRFRDVHFAYPSRPDVAALQEISFDVNPGEVVALVGPSGSGKSTIASLIPRFYDAGSGQITIDGVMNTELDTEWLRNQVGSVPQEPTLFGTSISENIAYGRLDAKPEEIEEAARAANAHEFVSDFPEGYQTEVGERGVRLSGGQKQRIAIARALLRNPRILILDEATSALDAESEFLVRQALDRLMVGRTTFIIAHRLSTVKHADRVLVLDKGQLVESGTHDQLMALDEGVYRRLVERQYFAAEEKPTAEA